jgi:predicted CopG family antitoxin
MPYRYAIKVSEEVYRRLLELTRKYDLESPNQLLRKLLFEEPLEVYTIRKGSRKIPIYKDIDI